MPLILAGTKGKDATAACRSTQLIELHLQIEFTSLVNQQLSINSIVLTCVGSTPTPHWVKEEYPELENEYPTLAVAIGGCSRELPQVAPESFDDFGGDDGTEGPWNIPPSFKGS